MTDKPAWMLLRLTCRCGHEWEDWAPNGVSVESFCAYLAKIRCQSCDALVGVVIHGMPEPRA